MASLGTLAAELKLEGAAGMMSGLRAVGGAVSSLGNVLGGIRAPLAQLDGALRAVEKTGAGTSAAVAPLKAAAAAIRQIPGQANRAAAALQSLGQDRAAVLGGQALRVNVGGMPGLNLSRAGSPSNRSVLAAISVGKGRRRDDAVGQAPRLALGADFARSLRGALGSLRSGSRDNGRASGGERRASGSGGTGARMIALLSQLRATGARTSEAGASAGIGSGVPKAGEGDRLARIGGFIGGGGGPALDFHRRTAAASEKTASGIQTLLQRLPTAEKPLTALWA